MSTPVELEKAQARIRELEEAITRVESKRRAVKLAADKLADAAEPAAVYLNALNITNGVGSPLAAALTAYREAQDEVR